MKLVKNFFTIIKGGINDAGEAFVKSEQERMYRQNIRNLDFHLTKITTALVNLKLEKEESEKTYAKIERKIEEYGVLIREHKINNREKDAYIVAEKIHELEEELFLQKTFYIKHEKGLSLLEQRKTMLTKQLNKFKREFALAQAHKSVNSAIKQVHNILDENLNINIKEADAGYSFLEQQEKEYRKIEIRNEITNSPFDLKEDKLKKTQKIEKVLERY